MRFVSIQLRFMFIIILMEIFQLSFSYYYKQTSFFISLFISFLVGSLSDNVNQNTSLHFIKFGGISVFTCWFCRMQQLNHVIEWQYEILIHVDFQLSLCKHTNQTTIYKYEANRYSYCMHDIHVCLKATPLLQTNISNKTSFSIFTLHGLSYLYKILFALTSWIFVSEIIISLHTFCQRLFSSYNLVAWSFVFRIVCYLQTLNH